jgi:dinuclear metal center YbgI/SA1388 family protein
MQLSEILNALEEEFPFSLQESYDNAGLIIGERNAEIRKVLICVDITEDTLSEAVSSGCNLIISHHPMVFTGMKRFTGTTATERLVASCLRSGIAVVALHTNLDNHSRGVNRILCDKLGILEPRILRPMDGMLRKLVTFCPHAHADNLRSALFSAGAGNIGNYDSCSFNTTGQGTFRALPGSDPFIGEMNKLHIEEEVRIEAVYPVYREKPIISALLASHPYEEVAYDVYSLSNRFPETGAGMVGTLETPADPLDFLKMVKSRLSLSCLKHTPIPGKKIQKVAVCGGSGSFLISDAMRASADVFLTGDLKYHDYFLPENRMLLGDIGHYESEQFTKELIFTFLKKKFPTFALQISDSSSNPVNYL